eukprot:gene23951-biopygen20862
MWAWTNSPGKIDPNLFSREPRIMVPAVEAFTLWGGGAGPGAFGDAHSDYQGCVFRSPRQGTMLQHQNQLIGGGGAGQGRKRKIQPCRSRGGGGGRRLVFTFSKVNESSAGLLLASAPRCEPPRARAPAARMIRMGAGSSATLQRVSWEHLNTFLKARFAQT